MSSDTIRIGALSGLADGEKQALCVRGQPIIVCNSGGQIYAIANECSHAFQQLDDGRVMAGWISCPAHGARFDLATGEPLNPPASEPIRTFPVIIENGDVFVDISGIA